MFCEKCGAILAEGSAFCDKCGYKQSGNRINGTQQDSSEKEKKESQSSMFGRNVTYISSTNASGFVEPDEIPLYSLANGTITHLMTGGGFTTNDAVLTNRRLYYSLGTGIINKVYYEITNSFLQKNYRKRRYQEKPILQGLQKLWKVVRCAGIYIKCNTYATGMQHEYQ